MQRNHNSLLPGADSELLPEAGPGFSFVDHGRATRRWLRSWASLPVAMDSDLISYQCPGPRLPLALNLTRPCDPEVECHTSMAMGFWIRERR